VVVTNSTDTKINQILITDMAGRLIQIRPASDTYNVIDMSNYPAGVYTVKAMTNKYIKTEKVIIR
jgi:ABC-type molybdate transport system substrate-binding protein